MSILKKAFILLMILLMVGVNTFEITGLYKTTTVYANGTENDTDADTDNSGGEKEKESDEDRPEPGNRDNVLKTVGSDAGTRGRILGAMKYNEQMQYLMTYTILKSKYMETGSYSGIYTEGKFYSGAHKDMEIGINAGHKNIVMSEDEDYSNKNEKDEVDKEAEKGDKLEKQKDEAIKKLTKIITDDYVNQYIHKYYMDDKTFDVGSRKSDETKTNVTPKTSQYGGTDIQKKYFKEFNEGGHYGKIRKEIESKVRTLLEANQVEEVLEGTSILTSGIAEEYKKGLSYKVESSSKGVQFEYYITKEKKSEAAIIKDLRFLPIKSTSRYLASISERNNITYDYDKQYAGEHKNWRTKATKTIKAKAEFKNYEKIMKGFTDDFNEGESAVKSEGVVGLGWMPLVLKTTDELKSKEEYKEFIKLFDGGSIIDKNKVELSDSKGTNSGLRALQVNDIFNINVKRDGKGSSASPYLSFDYPEYENINTGGAYIGRSEEMELEDGIGKYAGIKMDKIKKDNIIAYFDKNIKNVGIAKQLKEDEINTKSSKRLYPHRAISSMATDIKNISSLDRDADYVMGIDNYGNIISGATLSVVIPYWHNTEVSHFKDFNTEGSYFISTPIVNGKQASSTPNSLNKGSELGTPKEAGASVGGFSWVNDASQYDSFLSTVGSYVGNVNGLKEVLEGTDVGVTNTQALALAIVSQTKDQVAKFNKEFVELADKENELYIQPSNAGFETARASDADLLNNYTNKDLLDRIMMILDVGFFELLRLTIASWVVSFYTSSATNFQISSVFHTTLITDTAVWGELLRTISLLLIGFVGVYIVYMAFRLLRGTMRIKDFVKQFLAITLVLVIPTTVYSPLIHTVINEPTRHIVGKQMEQMSLLDAYLEKEITRREHDAKYRKLFGSVEDLRNRTDDYIVDFYTTQHVDGFDVTDVKYEDLSYKNQFRSIAMSETGKWRKTDLIKVRVSIFDLFEWVDDESDKDLFPWLVENHAKRYGGIQDYKEFRTSTAVNYPELGVSYAGDEWTASNLYRKIYRDVNSSGVDENISSLFSITEAFRNRGNTKDQAKITDVERERLVTDLALTADAREVLYGDGKRMSPSSEYLVEEYGGDKMSTRNGKAKAPENDFLALEEIVNDLVPYRDMTTTSLTKDVYDINKKVIDNYIMNYSLVREIVGDKSPYKLSEFNMIVMDMWFSVNKVLDLPMFPRTYDVATISFDSYMRMAYIPMDAFVSIEDKDLDNVSQFIALREHPMTLLFGFLPALIALLIFGAVYIAVFFVVMMIIMTLSFIWNYVIKNNTDNKSWLGALMIVGSFALAKLGLLILWRVMSFTLNYSYLKGGGLTYPYTLVHSLVIIGYLFVIFRYLFLNVLKAVMKDKANLGGEIFGNSVSKLVGNIINRVNGNAKSKSGEGGSSAGKEVDNEGEEGRIKRIAKGLTVSGLKNMVQDKMGYVNTNKEDIEAINEALNATGEMSTGDQFYNRFGKSVKGLKGKVSKKLAYGYDDIETDGYGLTEKERESLENSGSVGQILNTNADGSNITAMDAVTEESAEKIKSHLTDQGIKATVDGNKVYFNSQGLNLDSKEVRKGVFGGLIDKLVEETGKISNVEEEDVEEVKNYQTNGKGKIDIGVGKDGIDTASVRAVVESETFKEAFDVIEMPVVKDGKYLQGQMKVRAKDPNVNIEDVMDKLYKVDETMRTIQGTGEREKLSLTKAIELSSDERKITGKMVEGMKIQDNKIIYDSNNEEHVATVKEITRDLKTSRDLKQTDASDTIVRLMSQVTKGGNNGYNMETMNTSKDAKVKGFAQSSGILGDKVDTKVFVGKEQKVAKDLEQVRNLINANPKTVESYMESRDTLYREGEKILMGTGESSDRVLNEMMKFSAKNKVRAKELRKIEKKYEELGLRRKNSEIKESEYHKEVEGLVSDVQVMLQDKGVYEQLMTDTIRGDMNKKKKGKKSEGQRQEKTRILDEYVSSKAGLKDQGVDVSSIEKYQQQDFDKLGQLIGDIEEVQTNTDGTINITSSSKLEEQDIKSILNDLTGGR